MSNTERIAIVGLAGRFPGSGADLEQFWTNVASATDCSREVPPGRWLLPPERVLDSRVPHPDSVPSVRGYYLDPFTVDATGLNVPPDLLRQLDPLFHLVLDVGARAWQSARTERVERRNVGVILGNICLPTDSASDLARQYLSWERVRPARILDKAGGTPALPGGQPALPGVHPLNRYVAGLPAGLLAKGLGLGGGTFTLDAACASSLYAVKLACDELLSRRADVMLAGGVNRSDCLYTQMGFAQLRALSPSGRCSPFDAAADGLMVGEGAGVFVLKRLADAERDGDDIHAVLCGWGLSNDTTGNLLAPAKEGQLRAMRAAYQKAGWQPSDVDLIECHATGTPVGDAVEFDSLRELWGTPPIDRRCVIGSVKSSVGHLLTGAGAAALMKVLLAMKHRTLPPQANFTRPSDSLNYADGPLRVISVAEPWNRRDEDSPRRAAVSGFGFGGVNAHLLVEEYVGPSVLTNFPRRLMQGVRTSTTPPPPTPIAVVGLGAHVGSWANREEFQEFALGGGTTHDPRRKRNGWGGTTADCPPGQFIERLTMPLDRFRIPPRELEEMLPQQLLMLQVAAAAVDDAGQVGSPEQCVRTGVFVGLGLDLNTTNFHLRWAGAAELPPLTADRTMGALGSIAASRIARLFGFGGPSFTCCSEETSSGTAVQLAVRALRLGEIDRAVVGGVDLTGDPRQLLASAHFRPHSSTGTTSPLAETPTGCIPADGAAALVLKRLSDAERDGDRVYAIIRGVGVASGGSAETATSDASAYATALMRACTDAVVDPAGIDYLDAAASGTAADDDPEATAINAVLVAKNRPFPLSISASRAAVGHTGAASSAVALVRACVALHHEILPPSIPAERLNAGDKLYVSESPRYWLVDRGSRRRAMVASVGADGSCVQIILEEHAIKPSVVTQPLGARPEAVFVVDGGTPGDLLTGLQRLQAWMEPQGGRHIEYLARGWYAANPPHPARKLAVALVARDAAELREQIAFATEAVRTDAVPQDLRPNLRERVFYSPNPVGPKGKLAFVFPGSGNQFAGMGRDAAAHFPHLLRRQQAENQFLRGQYAPHLFWPDAIPPTATAKQFLFGQVTLGTLVSDMLVSFGLMPDAMIGQSLGESAGLFGMRVWTDRDEMFHRIQDSTLFGPDLGPPYRAARKQWDIPDAAPFEWVTAVIAASDDDVRSKLRPGLRAYLLIVSTPTECVIGGSKPDVEALAAAIGKPLHVLSGVTLAHCEAGKPVEGPYRELHSLPVTPVPNLKVYSGAWARSYALTRTNAAESITAGLLNTIDFPAVIEAAYRDGVRGFVEVGPGNSCTRMIAAVLGDRPHVVRAACSQRQNGISQMLRVLAACVAERFPVDLGKLYGGPALAAAHREPPTPSRQTVTVPVGLVAHQTAGVAETGFAPPMPQAQMPTPRPMPTPMVLPTPLMGETDNPPPANSSGVDDLPRKGGGEEGGRDSSHAPRKPEDIFASPLAGEVDAGSGATAAGGGRISQEEFDLAPLMTAAIATSAATADAHDVFLRIQGGFTRVTAEAIGLQNELVRRLMGDDSGTDNAMTGWAEVQHPVTALPLPEVDSVPRSLTFEQCTEFAVGKIGDVLGPLFAEIDEHPTRVRLPEGPLMLVDRIISIEGEPKSMTSGRVVTEHAVRADRWYLDNGRCPTSVTVESGQADLFLSGFLGIDFHTKGRAVYRLLDAVVSFHRGLPKVGERIEYDIRIDEFFRQADSWLFRFQFEGTVNGEPLLSMKNGVAGFFTAAALAAGQGIIHTKLDKQPMPGVKPADWKPFVPFDAPTSLSADQVNALHRGDLSAFGEAFRAANLTRPMKLPSGMLKLVDRVPLLDPTGGRFGLGFVRAEYDIKPKEWFIECHFVDDKVMPGTLMYECCLHTLRTLLMRFGWVAEDGEATCEPVPEINSRLKCRGQVLDTTKLVTYEVSIKEIGYRPEPYCIADALMYADGKPIVEITNLSLRMSGLTKERLEGIWANRFLASRERERPEVPRTPVAHAPGSPVLYGPDRILAYSNGNPSEAFGEPYRVFDRDRVIARLPGPPYQFLDRVVAVTGEPFVLKDGAACTAEYDVPPKEWYFESNRCDRMPFSVLLEIALQPCGWLAAYCGSALTSDTDLSFRNLGGTGTQFVPVGTDVGTLTTTVTMTKVSKSAGMIIQNYNMLVTAGERKVYEGTTYFGFFAKDALRNQVGMPTAKVPYLTDEQKAFADAGVLPHDPPFPAPMLRMVDRIDGYLPRGGKAGLGLIQGRIAVDPSFWFFKAHFYQDPVWPGSLGLESFLQLLKYVAWKRWKAEPSGGWQTVATNSPHTWTYRGQVVPTDREVTVVLEVTAVDETNRRLTADGFLTVDGRIIYQMQDFTLE